MDKRTEYIESLSTQILEWDRQIELLRDKTKRPAPAVKLDLYADIAALQFKRDEAAAKLQNISAASDDQWEDIMTGAENVMGEVRSMLRDTIMKLK